MEACSLAFDGDSMVAKVSTFLIEFTGLHKHLCPDSQHPQELGHFEKQVFVFHPKANSVGCPVEEYRVPF